MKGSITVLMEYNSKAVTGGTLSAYRVGEIREDNGNYSFTAAAGMEGFGGSFDNISAPELMEAVAAYVEAEGISAYATAENRQGRAAFDGLPLGLYLIVQTKASQDYEPIQPFLISVPMDADGQYVYEVSAEGKFRLTPKPTEPERPTEPTLSQTDQLNWPISTLAGVGLCLLLNGWVLGRKKDNAG